MNCIDTVPGESHGSCPVPFTPTCKSGTLSRFPSEKIFYHRSRQPRREWALNRLWCSQPVSDTHAADLEASASGLCSVQLLGGAENNCACGAQTWYLAFHCRLSLQLTHAYASSYKLDLSCIRLQYALIGPGSSCACVLQPHLLNTSLEGLKSDWRLATLLCGARQRHEPGWDIRSNAVSRGSMLCAVAFRVIKRPRTSHRRHPCRRRAWCDDSRH